jgi:hypothetical protein
VKAMMACALIGLAMTGHGGAEPAGPPGCMAPPLRPWAVPSSRWKAGWPASTASGCAP